MAAKKQLDILLTGGSGLLGSHTLGYLLQRGHRVRSLDRAPLPEPVAAKLSKLFHSDSFSSEVVDLKDYTAVDEVFAEKQYDGVIHLSAIPHPIGTDPREVHNNNVVTSWNVLQTAVLHGIRRITQASSVNAVGLSYTPEGRQRFSQLPITEKQPFEGMDPYALSKQICEIQAETLCRIHPDLRIASLRFHAVKPEPYLAPTHELYAWVSADASAEACLLGLTSEGWSGAEAFNIVSDENHLPDDQATLEVFRREWAGRFDEDGLRQEWWAGRPKRSLWDSTKAERLLGWKHAHESPAASDPPRVIHTLHHIDTETQHVDSRMHQP